LSSKLRWLLFSCWPRQGFHSTILWFSQSGDHSQNNLANFGYALDMKVGFFFFFNPSIFFAIYWNLS
jgi:hypothetical protein